MIDFLEDPKYIFKYVPFNLNTLKILIKGELWFGSMNNFNDPYDGEFDICDFDKNIDKRNVFLKKRLKNEISEKLFNGEYKNELILKGYMMRLIKSDIKDKIGISCFTNSPNNMLMWSHYADGHTGICLIFDKEKLINTINYQGITNNKIKVIEFKEENYIDDLLSLNIEFDDENCCFLNFDEVIKYKKKEWSYEKEIRLYYQFSKNVEYRFLQFHKEALCGIIFGLRTSFDNVYTIDYLIREMPHYNHLMPFHVKSIEKKDSLIFPGVPYNLYFKIDYYANEFKDATKIHRNWISEMDYEFLIRHKEFKKMK